MITWRPNSGDGLRVGEHVHAHAVDRARTATSG
jgi:hypothetical protein